MLSLKQLLLEEEGEKKIYPDRVRDALPGGLADKHDPSEFDQEQLMKGIHVEFEHTKDVLLALEISMDHLVENPYYYTDLEKIEKHA